MIPVAANIPQLLGTNRSCIKFTENFSGVKVRMFCEAPFGMHGNGVHTAYQDSLELLAEGNDVEVLDRHGGRGDVFHSHTYGPRYFWAGRKYRGRRVFTAHVIPDSVRGSFPMWKLILPLSKWYLKRVYQYADVCLAISPRVAEAIRESGARTRIVAVPNPVMLDRWKFSPEKREKGRKLLQVGEEEFLVLGVGQLVERKGVEEFLDVVEAVPGAGFVWAGGRPFGPFSDGLLRINARIAKAPGNVRFTGMLELEQMPLVYAAADMLLFPSHQENCPLAPLEAAACGLPVVFRDLPEYRLLFGNPYLKAATTDEFAALTRRLIADRDFYRQAREMSRQLVTQFDRKRIREDLVGIYRSLLIN